MTQSTSNSEASRLLRMSRRGSREALGQLLTLYSSCLRATANQHLRGPVVGRMGGSDLVQETLLQAHAHFDQFSGETSREFSAWLRTILKRNAQLAYRTHVDAGKRSVRREEAIEPAPHADPDQLTASGTLMQAERLVWLARSLDALPPDQKEAVRLHYIEGWTLLKISKHLGRSPAAAAGLLKRGLFTLRERAQRERHESQV